MFRIHLFGRFRVEYGDEPVEGLGTFKVQELLSHLLIHRNRPRPREAADPAGPHRRQAERHRPLRGAVCARGQPPGGSGSPQVRNQRLCRDGGSRCQHLSADAVRPQRLCDGRRDIEIACCLADHLSRSNSVEGNCVRREARHRRMLGLFAYRNGLRRPC